MYKEGSRVPQSLDSCQPGVVRTAVGALMVHKVERSLAFLFTIIAQNHLHTRVMLEQHTNNTLQEDKALCNTALELDVLQLLTAMYANFAVRVLSCLPQKTLSSALTHRQMHAAHVLDT